MIKNNLGAPYGRLQFPFSYGGHSFLHLGQGVKYEEKQDLRPFKLAEILPYT